MTVEFKLPEVLTRAERAAIEDTFTRASEALPLGGKQSAIDAAEQGFELLAKYDALLVRVRLAELVLYRAKLLSEDMEALIANGKKQRAGGPQPEGIANMASRYVRDYVDVIIGSLREAVGFQDGQEREGWYLSPEDLRAKLIGAARAADQDRRARIRSEGGI